MARPTHPVGNVLRALARIAIAGSVGAASGCDDGWEPIPCTEGKSNAFFDPVFTRELDYAGLYRDIPTNPEANMFGTRVDTLGTWGKVCGTASDSDACMSKFEAASTRESCRVEHHCGMFAILTHADEITVIDERSAFIDLLAGFENASNALAISTWNLRPIKCGSDDRDEVGTRYKRADTYDFETVSFDCNQVRHTWRVFADGKTSEVTDELLDPKITCVVGRRPAGLLSVACTFRRGTLAAYFAETAHFEAASVFAFERLARELSGFCAPPDLIAAAARSALDEIQHARATSELARHYGGAAYPVQLAPLPARNLFEVALENAVEGCIHETFGALLAQHQAALASDPLIREVMRVIARDETRHAQLAWQVADWIAPRLSARERTHIDQAQRAALAALKLGKQLPTLPPSAASTVGLPSPLIARQLARGVAHMVRNLQR